MKVTCNLCIHHCTLEEGETGYCRARTCRDGKIVSLNYGRVTTLRLRPTKSLPFLRFEPDSKIVTTGSFGCNMHCPYCWNYETSMAGIDEAEGIFLSPQMMAQRASQLKPAGSIGVAFTYNEPLVGCEFVRDCALELHSLGMKCVLVTNGLIEEGPWRELLPLIDAVNIDLKCFSEGWYREMRGDLGTVKRSIEIAAGLCPHLEVTTLIVPHRNDSFQEIGDLCRWLASIDRDIPLHLSRFVTDFEMMGHRSTSRDWIQRLTRHARTILTYVCGENC